MCHKYLSIRPQHDPFTIVWQLGVVKRSVDGFQAPIFAPQLCVVVMDLSRS